MKKKNCEIILYLFFYINFYLYIEIELDKNEWRKYVEILLGWFL